MKKWLAALAALILLAAGLVAGYVVYKRQEAADVRGSSTEEFVATEAEEPVPPPPAEESLGVAWPLFGYDPERHRVGPYQLKPPFRRIWTFRARQLLEFPPVIGYGRLYFTNNSGVMFAVNAKTGKRAWKKPIGRCVAATPAVGEHTVFQSFMNRPPCNSKAKPGRLEGEVIAFATGFGKIRWRTKIGPTESSPLLADGRVYVGDWRGRVYSLDERTGRVRWTFQGKGRIKGAVAKSGNRLFVGTYDGYLYAIRASTGKVIWRTRSQDRLGGRGQFYSTPAVAYGRVYIGSTDGKVYSYGAASGTLRWSQGTGGYVYGSPAVWRKTVYVGSYSGRFYALDAATGDVKWRFQAKGDISGSATVLERRRLLLDLRRADLRARRPHRQAALDVPGRQVRRRRRRLANASTSSATRASMGWSSGEVRRHRRRGLHRLASGRDAARGRAMRSSRVDSYTDYYERSRKERNAAALDVLELDLAEAPLEPILAGADGVFHLAGQPGVRASWGESFALYLRAQRPRHAAALRGRGGRGRPRRLRVVLLRLRRRRALPDARRTWRRSRSRPTGSRSSPASSSRTRSAAGRGSTRSCSATSPSTARGSGPTWRSPRCSRRSPAATASGSSATAARRGASRTSATRSPRRSRRWSAAAAARSTTSAAATRRR